MKLFVPQSISERPVELSLVVPCFNENPHIERVLTEWLAEIRELGIDFETIVVNDGSLDGSGRILDKMRKEHPELRVVHQLNMGSARACRRGIEMARGAFVLVVNANGRCEPSDFSLFWSQRANHDLVIARRSHRLDGFMSKQFSRFTRAISHQFFGLAFQEPSLSYRLMRRTPTLALLPVIPIDWTSFHYCLTVLFWKQSPSRIAEIKIPYRHRLERKSPFHRTGFFSLAWTYLKETLLLKFRLIRDTSRSFPQLDSALRA